MTTVSFVVPTRNSARTISACVMSLRSQTYPHVEIVVVDNDSTDDTASRAAAAGADRVIIAGPERCAQRNRGAERARRHRRVHRLGHGDGAGPRRPDRRTFERGPSWAPSSSPSARSATASGRSAGCWRSRCTSATIGRGGTCVPARGLRGLGGWNETLTAAEDWDLDDRIRATAPVGRIDAFIWHDEGNLRLRGTFGKKRYYGHWIAAYLDAHDDGSRRIRRSGLLDKKGDLLRHPSSHGHGDPEVRRGGGHLRRHARRPRQRTGPARARHDAHASSTSSASTPRTRPWGARSPRRRCASPASTTCDDAGARRRRRLRQRARARRPHRDLPDERADRLHALLDEIDPDVVHLHAGPSARSWPRSGLGRYPLAMTIYAWPACPVAPHGSTRAGRACARATSCRPACWPRPRFRPPSSARPCAPSAARRPVPRPARRRAAPGCGVPVEALPSGAPVDPRRASRTRRPARPPPSSSPAARSRFAASGR